MHHGFCGKFHVPDLLGESFHGTDSGISLKNECFHGTDRRLSLKNERTISMMKILLKIQGNTIIDISALA